MSRYPTRIVQMHVSLPGDDWTIRNGAHLPSAGV